MNNIELQRGHDGQVHLVVGGQFAAGAKVTGMQAVGDDLCAIVVVPLKHAVFGEVRNVVPFVRPQAA